MEQEEGMKAGKSQGTDGRRDADNEADAPLVGGMTRRTLCLGAGGAAVMLGLGTLKFAPAPDIVRPPGGQDEDRLVSSCIRCEKCYEVCPRNVIKPAHLEDGVLNIRTPTLDFSDDWCDFCKEENGGTPLCVKSCPTAALQLDSGAKAETTIIGKAEIVEDWCLAYQLNGCRFCYDACPYKAISLDSEKRPVVDEDLCNGCGACESVCVSFQSGSVSQGASSRAISVKAPSGSRG